MVPEVKIEEFGAVVLPDLALATRDDFDDFYAKLVNGLFLHGQPGIFNISLDDGGAPTVDLIILK